MNILVHISHVVICQGPAHNMQTVAQLPCWFEQKQPKADDPVLQDSIWEQVRKELGTKATISGSPEVPCTNLASEPEAKGLTKLGCLEFT